MRQSYMFDLNIIMINITKNGKRKNILTMTIFLVGIISTIVITITPPIRIDASAIIATKCCIITNIFWKIKGDIERLKNL